jgi:hypothetical protein
MRMSVSFNSVSATLASRHGRINLFAAAMMGLAAVTSSAGDSGVPQGFVEVRPGTCSGARIPRWRVLSTRCS